VALVVSLTTTQMPTGVARYALVVPLALAMGIQNAAAQRLAVPELTTTVLTRTLTGIASEARLLGGGHGSQAGRRLLAVGAMLLGAIAGALLALDASIAAAIAIVLAVAIAVHVLSRLPAPWTRP
jgi:uncharacterized membrane protein YoaK (UPF0700 family)